MYRRMDRLLERLAEARTLKDAAETLVQIGRILGLERAAAVEDFTSEGLSLSRSKGLLYEIFGWLPAQARCEDGQSLNEVCPIGQACRITSQPFTWRAADIGNAPFTWDKRARDFWRAAATQGIVGGITVPVHMPLSRVGAVGWLSMDPEVDLEAVLDRWGTSLRMAAFLFMDRVLCERPPERAPPNPPLSARELQCLTWVALGKTDVEIAQLIERSPATARFHIESAIDKLAVNNRARAVAVACQMGMIRALA